MVFWKKKKQEKEGSSSQAEKVVRSKTRKRFPVEVKLLAAKARHAGLSNTDVARMVGSSTGSVDKWWHKYREGGAEALITSKGNPGARKLNAEIERRIEAHRLQHPEHGVRRISDELKRNEG
jgi:transposase